MDGRAIGAAALAYAGLRGLASEMDGPRPAGIELGKRTRAAGMERMSAPGGAQALRPARS